MSTEPLTMLTNASGFGRGNNPPSSYEIVTCQPAAVPPCELQYGPRVAFGFGSEIERCGTTPAGRSTRCYSSDTELRMFFGSGVEVQNVYLLFTTFQSGGAPYDLRPYDGTDAVLGLSGNIGHVYRYGTLESLDGVPGPTAPAPNLDSPYHQASVRRWRFSLPEGAVEDPAFGFAGQVYGTLSTVPHAPHQVSVRGNGAPTPGAVSSGCMSQTTDYTVVASVDPLLPNHPAGTSQVYRVRRRTGEAVMVSVDGSGVPGDGSSTHPCLSADGVLVSFESTSSNLVAGDVNGVSDVFVRDTSAGSTVLASPAASDCGRGGGSIRPQISDDGSVVAFSSTCATLCGGSDQATGCYTGRRQVYRFLRASGTLEGVSVRTGTSGAISSSTRWGGAGAPLSAGTHNSHLGGLSADGSQIAFVSSAYGVGALGSAADDTATRDVFVRSTSASTTTRISNDRGGAVGSRNAQISSNGVWVVFESASSFLSGDTNGQVDVFRCDASGGSCGLVSSPNVVGGFGSNGASGRPTVSGDGSFVAFESAATNLIGGDSNGVTDVFVRDFRDAGVTLQLVSRNGAGMLGDGASTRASISRDGAYVMFESTARNLLADSAGNFDDDGESPDVFVIRR
ncbi:MAG: hypothetical protein J0L92_11760 [Deltaproteobacteria bacterium]|nr:hypothetical protein [Deltaproteobacteria bacterium]